LARKFLYVIAGIVVLVFAALLALRIWSEELSEWAFVPNGAFAAPDALDPRVWERPDMWVSRPDIRNDPVHWLPPGVTKPAASLPVSVFFVHPTSYIGKTAWNARLDEADTRNRADLFVQGMASPFNEASQLWAPRYRQAAVGAFLTGKPEAEKAIDVAYGDVLAAFDLFVKRAPADQPIVLAGHSQGAFLLRRLLRDRVAGTPLANRIVAAYVIGWPVSLAHDLPRMGLAACRGPSDTGCVVSWLSVADPADTTMLVRAYGRRTGLDGRSVADSPFLCTNPLTGRADVAAAPASANMGTLVPHLPDGKATGQTSAQASGELAKGVVPAACGPDHFLHIGPPPQLEMGPYVLPGNNYHLYDVPLFWANLRSDFERRVGAWQTRH